MTLICSSILACVLMRQLCLASGNYNNSGIGAIEVMGMLGNIIGNVGSTTFGLLAAISYAIGLSDKITCAIFMTGCSLFAFTNSFTLWTRMYDKKSTG